jgi:hypothetical protein
MAAIVNARDVILQAESPRVLTVALPSTTTIDFGQVTGTTRPADNADVTSSILGSSGTSIVMSNANLFKSSSGLGGVFIGSGGIVGKNGSGATTFSVDGTTGALSATGNITGASNLTITGQATFDGSVPAGSLTTAVYANASGAAQCGLIGVTNIGTGAAIKGIGGSGGGSGVIGAAQAISAVGVLGTSSNASGKGGSFQNSGGGTALEVIGVMAINTTTLVSNLNADLLDGQHASAFQPAGSYALASHDHSAFQASGLNVFNITTASRAAQYSTDGGSTWTDITFRFQ